MHLLPLWPGWGDRVVQEQLQDLTPVPFVQKRACGQPGCRSLPHQLTTRHLPRDGGAAGALVHHRRRKGQREASPGSASERAQLPCPSFLSPAGPALLPHLLRTAERPPLAPCTPSFLSPTDSTLKNWGVIHIPGNSPFLKHTNLVVLACSQCRAVITVF